MTEPDKDLNPNERLRRWRLLLGEAAGESMRGLGLSSDDQAIDKCLGQLYDESGQDSTATRGRGGLGRSAPNVARWLGDVRKYFPVSVVRVMQKDAMQRFNVQQMLLEPELLEVMEADVHLVANLISLSGVIPETTKATARAVVRKVTDDLMARLEAPMRQAIMGALNRAVRNYRPRLADMDWNRTIRANLKHYQPGAGTIIPETWIGYGRKQRKTQKEIILCIDQSGSMASSVVYSSIFGAVMASIPSVRTRLVVFDTSVVDMTEKLDDPVDILFGVQLGGGTDINRALTYCHGLVTDPTNTIMILISDLIEGGNQEALFKRVGNIVGSGIQMVTLLALSDEGAPMYDHNHASLFADMGVPSFACSPDKFPELMATAISKRDVAQWASENGIVSSRGNS
jgi:hypothetical protein